MKRDTEKWLKSLGTIFPQRWTYVLLAPFMLSIVIATLFLSTEFTFFFTLFVCTLTFFILIAQGQHVVTLNRQLHTQTKKMLEYREILEDSRDAIIMFDMSGLITFWNCGATEIYHYTQQEALGKNIKDLMPEDSTLTSLEALQELMDKGIGGTFETRRQTSDGDVITVSVAVVLNTDEDLNILGLTTNERDLSDRIVIEEALRKAKDEAEQATKTKSEFLANMSHEIRTPMNGVLGMTELLLNTELTDEQHEHLQMVKSSADALLQIINDILDFSKIEAGKIEFEKVPFALSQLLSTVGASLNFRAKEKDIELVLVAEDSVPRHLIGDPTRLSQVIINLVGNAIKFTPHEGGICVQVRVKESSADLATLHFVVADSGVGIPSEKQSRIFEAFSQADSSTARHFGGTGLGLSISTMLVHLMGGEIWVKSDPGKGSAFHFTASFPITNETALPSNTHPADETKTFLKKLRVLVAEDNLINQKLTIHLLEKDGHSVTVVANGKDAVDRVSTEEFDLVLMDCQMPIMGGFEATSEIRAGETNPGKRVPIIALTANAMKGDRERCIEAGMDDYVSKPIKRTELYAAIERSLK